MSPHTLQPAWPGRLLRWAAAAITALAAVVAGCGGGVGVGGTGAFASGPITGLGSIFVNGIEFEIDDRVAEVLDDSGGRRTSDALHLGMLVEVESGPVSGSSGALTATATRVRFASELIGPVDSVDVAGSRLQVLGQTVEVVAGRTAFDASYTNGLASVVAGTNVEVYGLYGPGGRLFATRIEPRGGTLASFKLRGPVNGLDTTAQTFQLGALTLSYRGIAPPAGLTDGLIVRVTVAPAPSAGVWTVLTFEGGVRRLPDGDDTRLRGTVTSVDGVRLFSVNGQPVDARAASFDNEAGVVLGARVEVEGATRDGVLLAATVKLDDSGGAEEGDLRGAIEAAPGAQTFVVRGVRVIYADATRFDNGAPADLVIGREVEVRGLWSPDGTKLLATRIRFR